MSAQQAAWIRLATAGGLLAKAAGGCFFLFLAILEGMDGDKWDLARK